MDNYEYPTAEFVRDWRDGGSCAALTVKGKPCRNPIFWGQFWTYNDDNTRVIIGGDDQERLTTALCPTHRRVAGL